MHANATPAKAAGATNRTDPKWIVVAVAVVVCLCVAPFYVYPLFLMKVMCFALFAAAFNLLLGYTGLLSFGHAAFFGGAAYFTAHMVKEWGLPPEIGILGGVLGAAVLGLAIGVLAVRREGIYFAMVTMALAQMFYFFCYQAPFTHGEDGIQAVPRGTLFGLFDLENDMTMYFFVASVFVLSLAAIWRIVHSPFGMILKSIRENESRAISLGYSVTRYKLAAFVMSATFAGLAGSMKTLVFKLASLTDVSWHTSGEVVLMSLLGGLGTQLGPVVGAGLVVTLQNYLVALAVPVTVIVGSVFMICVLMFRRGIVGEFIAWKNKDRGV